jgi:hypothetical protein
VVLRESPSFLYRLGSISIEEIETVRCLKIQIHKGEAPIALWYAFKTLCTQTKILSETITQDLILFDKRVGVLTYQTFFENENIVAHEFCPYWKFN